MFKIGRGCGTVPPNIMKILSWNCRRLGNSRIVQSICFLVNDKGPDVVFLMETKLSYFCAQAVTRKFRYEGCIVVESIGRNGGLVLLWKQQDQIELVNYSQRHINIIIKDIDS